MKFNKDFANIEFDGFMFSYGEFDEEEYMFVAKDRDNGDLLYMIPAIKLHKDKEAYHNLYFMLEIGIGKFFEEYGE